MDLDASAARGLVRVPDGVVADHMLRHPKTTGADASVGELHRLFDDDHVHLALLVRRNRLVGCVVRDDLAGAPPDTPALEVSTLAGRIVGPDATMRDAADLLVGVGVRRLAVVARDGRLLGLLALKRSGAGFCTDEGVRARAASRDG